MIAVFVLLSFAVSDAERVARADAALARQDAPEALRAVDGATTPAAALLRGRALRALNRAAEVGAELKKAAQDPELADLVALERGLLAHAQLAHAETVAALAPLVERRSLLVGDALAALAPAWAAHDPEQLVRHFSVLERGRRPDDLDARSFLLGQKAAALRRLGREADALATDKQRYLEEPVSLLTPTTVPQGLTLTLDEALQRVDALQVAHRSERVVAELQALSDAALSESQRCRKYVEMGLALRKLRDYARSEEALTTAVATCAGQDERLRRASYLRAKVVSIRDGLRAVPLIEAFVTQYPDHSMADDVLFWAGDLYQRRGKDAQATAYYERIGALPQKDDQCAEARWRLAWMRYRRGDTAGATTGFTALLQPNGCSITAFDRARARYWLGRLAQPTAAAVEHYEATFREDALGFYAQAAFARLQAIAPARAQALATEATPPPAGAAPKLCKGFLESEPAFALGETWLTRGLRRDAARAYLAVPVPTRQVISSDHASAQGVRAQPVVDAPKSGAASTCDERTPRLLLALRLDEAGAYKDAHWRLRTDFAAELSALPKPETWVVWRAAYPLAWRDAIAAAEREQGVPELFLQALAREESAFDPQAVSWAGAYGLTQLLLITGQDAGRRLRPVAKLTQAEELLEPRLNARLGGAFLSSLLKRFRGNAALALAAYNAGIDVATTWWKRHQNDEIDVLAEEITIHETRGYVKRVLRTYGIYRWLYSTQPPALPVAMNLPAANP